MSRGDCSFEQKIKTASENKAQAVIVYNTDPDVFTMITRGKFAAHSLLQAFNNLKPSFETKIENPIVNVFVSVYVGDFLMQAVKTQYAETFITIEPNYFDFDDSKGGFPARASVYFVFVSFFFVIAITLSWIVVFYVQRIRSATAKKRLEVYSNRLFRFFFNFEIF